MHSETSVRDRLIETARAEFLLKNYLAEIKERLESLAQVYINDIHVMVVFLGRSHNEILGYQLDNAWGVYPTGQGLPEEMDPKKVAAGN